MRRFGKIMAAAGLASLAFTGTASATDFYVTAFGSINFTNNSAARKLNPADPNAVPPVEQSFSTGTLSRKTTFDLGGAVGIIPWEDENGRLRVEAEVTYKDGNLGQLELFDAVRFSTGDQNVITFMANGYMDFKNLGGRISPYLGAGLGVAAVKTDLTYLPSTTFNADPAFRWSMNDTDYVFAFQVMAGVSAPIVGRLSGYAEVRYFRSSDSTVAVTEEIAAVPSGTFTTRYATILTRFGLRYGF